MKIKHLIEELSKFPEDYEVDLSAYMKIMPDKGEDDEDYYAVVDNPLIGLASNEETKEVRFVIQGYDNDALINIDGNMKPLEG